jgi:signal transduction histidine kinase
VLVVDSDRGIHGAVAGALAGSGFEVSTVCGVAAAIEVLQQTTIDCVLIDEDVEEAANGRVSAELSRYPSQTVSLIVVSNGSRVSRLKALRRGAFECIEKECDPALLRLVVVRAIERVTLARTMRELLEEVEAANAELSAAREQLQARVEEATHSLRLKVDELDRARHALENAQRQREEFIHIIAHELGGPLTAMEGYAEMLGYHEVPPELHRRASTIMRSEIRRFARLVQDLTCASETPDELQLQLDDHDLAEVVCEQVEVTRAMTSTHCLLAEVPDGPVGIRCDRDRIGEVVFNVLSNAVKYSGGREIRVRLTADRHAADLRISNDGPSIPVDRLEAIFERRVRLPETGARQRSGRGLGLYVARRIAEAHGGTLHAMASPAGAEFVLRLPRTSSAGPNGACRGKVKLYELRTNQ